MIKVKSISDPIVADLARAKIADLEARYGTASRDDRARYLGGVEITDIEMPEWKIYQDIDALRGLVSQSAGGRKRMYFVLARALNLIGVSLESE